jgi:flagella basal body P-ring formation protein FlgA
MRQDADIVNGMERAERRGTPWWVWPLAWLGMVLLFATVAHAQTSVVLKPSAVIPDGARAITLGDVAEIDPPTTPDGAKLTEIVLVENAAAAPQTIGITQVRAAMDAAQVQWARITLRGANCKLSVSAPAPVASAAPAAKAPVRPATGMSTPQTVDMGGVQTIRVAIAGRLLALYGVADQDLRVGFDAGDDDFLDQSIGDRRVDVQPAATGASARTPVNVFIYEGDRLTTTRLVSTQALIDRAVVTARSAITKGEAISPEAIESSRQWVSPNSKPSISADLAAGQLAARNIAAGATLTAADITPPVVCKRGDLVWVHVLSGGMSVKAKARAMEQARDGERVHLKLDGSDRVFCARMSGPGKAVMIADDTDDAPRAGDSSSGAPLASSAPAVRPVRKSR